MGLYGISLALCHPEQGGGSFPASPWERGSPGAGHSRRWGVPGTHSSALSAPASPAVPSVGIYLHQVCKSEHVIFPLSSPGEGLWPERSRQIFEAGSREPALTLRGSLASPGHSQIKDADFATRIGPWQPQGSHGKLGISSR